MRCKLMMHAAALAIAAMPVVRADILTDCGSMLKPVFDWAASSTVYAPRYVYATISRHYASQSDKMSDPVFYSNGEVRRYVNVLAFPTAQDFRGVLPMKESPVFAVVSGQATSVIVGQTGWVQIQETAPGVLFVPQHFQATCSGGLIRGAAGSISYTISLTRVAPTDVP